MPDIVLFYNNQKILIENAHNFNKYSYINIIICIKDYSQIKYEVMVIFFLYAVMQAHDIWML